MSAETILLTAQTIILGVTGYFVYMYTRETQKLREETANQSKIMQNQFKLLLQDQQDRIKALQNEARPILSIKGAQFNPTQVRLKITNKGGLMDNVKLNFRSPDIIGTCPNVISDGEFDLSIGSPKGLITNEIFFTMEYTNKLNQRIQAEYKMNIQTAIIRQKAEKIIINLEGLASGEAFTTAILDKPKEDQNE